MRRVMLCAAVGVLSYLASIQSAAAQTSETIGLLITRSEHWSEVAGAALGVWSVGNTSQSETLAQSATAGSLTDESGASGDFNIQGSSRLVAGAEGVRVSGLNVTASAIGQMGASGGGSADLSIHMLQGTVDAEVQTTTSTNPGTYIAEGTISFDGVYDGITGTTSHNTISRNGIVMAELYGSGQSGYGYTTDIIDGQEQQVWFYSQAGESLSVKFYTAPGDQISMFQELDMAGTIYSSGPGDTVGSQAGIDCLEDIQVTFYED